MRLSRTALIAALALAGSITAAVAQPVIVEGPPPGWSGPHYYWHGHHWHHRHWYHHGWRYY